MFAIGPSCKGLVPGGNTQFIAFSLLGEGEWKVLKTLCICLDHMFFIQKDDLLVQ